MIALIYFVLKWTEFIVLYLVGKRLEKPSVRTDVFCEDKRLHLNKLSEGNYWRTAFGAIIAFGLIEGLRWGRMVDYNIYAEKYAEIDWFFTLQESSKPGFTSVVYFLKSIGISYPMFLVLQSGFLMYSALFLLRDFRPYLRWILPMLMVAFSANENLVSFYLAIPFVLISVSYLLHDDYKRTLLYTIIACTIHFGLVPFVLIIATFRLLNKKAIPPLVGVVLLIATTFFINISQMTHLVVISSIIASSFGDAEYAAVGYLEGMEDIITGSGAGGTLIFAASITNKIKTLLTFVPMIIWGKKYLENYKYGTTIYNLAVINIIINGVIGQAEVLMRYVYMFNIFVVIALGAVIYNLRISKQKKWHALLAYAIIFFYCYSLVTGPFVREDFEMYFLWDSNGRATNWAPY